MIEFVVARRTRERLVKEIERGVWSGPIIARSHQIDGLFEPQFRPGGMRASPLPSRKLGQVSGEGRSSVFAKPTLVEAVKA